MNTYPYYEVNAFTDSSFSGNPAGVCLLDQWLPDKTLLAIAAQNNLSETAFVVKEPHHLSIRWFTPLAEVDLCGHATLATAHVLMNKDWPRSEPLTFHYGKGVIPVKKTPDGYEMSFPSRPGKIFTELEIFDQLGISPVEALLARDLIIILDSEEEVRSFKPDLAKLQNLPGLGFVVTSRGQQSDFISRCFFPKIGIPEDPVTGSVHCTLAPLWAAKLGKSHLHAQQISQRGGELWCEVKEDSVLLIGKANTYLEGVIHAH